MCEYLAGLCSGIFKAPCSGPERVRKQFAGRVFEAPELTEAIEDARKMVSEITGSLVVQGPGRISGMFDTRDQLQAATDDLLGAERDATSKASRPTTSPASVSFT